MWEKEGNSIRVDNGEEETLSVEGRRRRINNCMSNKKGGGENSGRGMRRRQVEGGGKGCDDGYRRVLEGRRRLTSQRHNLQASTLLE